MGFPIATKKSGFICFSFPDVCKTPAPPSPSPVPIPYPNIGQLSDATGTSNSVRVGGDPVITKVSEIPQTTGDEAGSIGGVTSNVTKGKVKFTSYSSSVRAEGKEIVRMFDTTEQNIGGASSNAVGTVLGGVPNVLVGG